LVRLPTQRPSARSCVDMGCGGSTKAAEAKEPAVAANPQVSPNAKASANAQVPVAAAAGQPAPQLTGTSVLTGSRDGTLRLWCLKKGECIGVMKGHSDHVRCMSVSWSAQRAVSGSVDNTLRLWNLKTCTCIREFTGGLIDDEGILGASANGAAVDPGSPSVASETSLVSGASLMSPTPIHAGLCVAMDTAAKQCLSPAIDHTLRLWNLDNGACLAKLPGHSDTIWCVVADWQEGRALTGSHDCSLRLWDLKGKSCTQVFEGHTKTVVCVAADWKAQRFLSGSNDNTMRLWNLSTGECLREISADRVRCICMDWINMRAVTGGDPVSLRLWDLASGGDTKDVAGERYSRCVEVDWRKQHAVTGGNDGVLHMWDLDSGVILREIWGHSSEIMCLALNWPGPSSSCHQP